MRIPAYGVAFVAGGIALVLAAIAAIDGSGPRFEGQDYYRVIGPGWGGLAMALAVVALAALGLRNRERVAGYYLAIAAASGLLVGGTLPIAAAMLVALVAGLVGAMGQDSTAIS
jgi:hypothetical protein